MKTLTDFRDTHKGERIIVCGIGPSLGAMANVADRGVTIGVNDIGRTFDPGRKRTRFQNVTPLPGS
jgi:hypothetical protein